MNKELDILRERHVNAERHAARRRAFQEMVQVLHFEQTRPGDLTGKLTGQELSLSISINEPKPENRC